MNEEARSDKEEKKVEKICFVCTFIAISRDRLPCSTFLELSMLDLSGRIFSKANYLRESLPVKGQSIEATINTIFRYFIDPNKSNPINLD